MWAASMRARPEVVGRLDALRSTYLARRRLAVDDLLPEDTTRELAAELRALTFKPVVNVPVEGARRPPPRYWHHHAIVQVAPEAPGTPLQAFIASLTCGALRDFIEDVTGCRELHNRLGTRGRPILVAHAYPRGGYLEVHGDDAVDGRSRRAVSMVWHASTSWDASWGGLLRFTQAPQDVFVPRFGALHLFEPSGRNEHEVSMVTGPEVRYTLSGWLYESVA